MTITNTLYKIRHVAIEQNTMDSRTTVNDCPYPADSMSINAKYAAIQRDAYPRTAGRTESRESP